MPADKNYSYSDGDQYYTWSPDSKWLLVSFGNPERLFTPEVGLVSGAAAPREAVLLFLRTFMIDRSPSTLCCRPASQP